MWRKYTNKANVCNVERAFRNVGGRSARRDSSRSTAAGLVSGKLTSQGTVCCSW